MSALPGGIGPVSVRYAAQIREMLYVQAIDRAVAEQEAARAASEAERKERLAPNPVEEPARVEAPAAIPAKPEAQPNPVRSAETATTAKLVDIQA